MNTINRRLELLKLEGLGFSQAEIAQQLSQKAGCSKRTIYLDFESRAQWQPTLHPQKTQETLLKIGNRYEQIYRQAAILMFTSENEMTKIAALNTMLKANTKMYETAVVPEVLSRLEALEGKAKKGVFVP